jgi:hypothetical protein
VLLFAGTNVRADIIYSYTTDAQPTSIDTGPGHSGALTISVQASPTPISANDTFFNAAQVTGATLTGDNYAHAGYYLDVNITDAASNVTKSVKFTGEFNGSFLPGGSKVYNTLFVNNDPSQPILTGSWAQTISFADGASYNISLNALANVNNQGSPIQTIIGGEITVLTTANSGGGDTGGGDTGGNTSNSPEPSTMLLSCLGLTCLGASAWRKRRKLLAAR